jgi:hypothetical protein
MTKRNDIFLQTRLAPMSRKKADANNYDFMLDWFQENSAKFNLEENNRRRKAKEKFLNIAGLE